MPAKLKEPTKQYKNLIKRIKVQNRSGTKLLIEANKTTKFIYFPKTLEKQLSINTVESDR